MIFINTKAASTSVMVEHMNTSQKTERIDHFIANNVGLVAATLTAHLIPSGGVIDDTNKVLVVSIEPGKSYPCGEMVGADLDRGDSIAVGSTTDSVVIRCNGRQV